MAAPKCQPSHPSNSPTVFGAALVWAMVSVVGAMAQPMRVGGEFQINTYSSYTERDPQVALDRQGRFGVVWHGAGSTGDDTSGSSIQMRLFAADATAEPQFQVNIYTTGPQSVPQIAADGQGNFIVVWTSDGSSGSDNSLASIQGRRFASSGAPLSDEVQINTYTTGSQGGLYGGPSVAADAAGNFIVVWSSASGAFSADVKGQRFDSTGALIGPEFQVNTSTTGDQGRPQIAVAADGDFVVAWQSGYYVLPFQGGYDKQIRARRFASTGSALGGDFSVNSYTSGDQSNPSVAVLDDGGFVIVWQSGGLSGAPDGSPQSIFGQRYGSTGGPLGGEFQVNTYTTGSQGLPFVAVGDDGQQTVTWQSSSSTTDPDVGVFAQRFATDGSFLGPQFQVNTTTAGNQQGGALSLRQGRSVIVWSGPEIHGQRFCDGFCNGFESGDTCTWSATVPPPGACPP